MSTNNQVKSNSLSPQYSCHSTCMYTNRFNHYRQWQHHILDTLNEHNIMQDATLEKQYSYDAKVKQGKYQGHIALNLNILLKKMKPNISFNGWLSNERMVTIKASLLSQ